MVGFKAPDFKAQAVFDQEFMDVSRGGLCHRTRVWLPPLDQRDPADRMHAGLSVQVQGQVRHPHVLPPGKPK